MKEIKNEFSWSFSRQLVFDTCLRQYYFRYYQFWEGWNRDSPEVNRKAYLFSKMMTLPMLIGSAVHATIEEILRSRRDGRPIRDPVERLRGRLNQTWLDSLKQRWLEVGPKKAPPLFEHYYQLPVEQAEIARLKDHAIQCIHRFLESELYRDIVEAGPDRWRTIDELSKVEIEGVSAFVAPDFAFDRGDQTWLIDWKTGAEREEMDLQLLSYAVFAIDRWNLPVERLRAFDFFLAQGRLAEIPLSEERLAEARRTILERSGRMRALLLDVEHNAARPEEFPPTTDPRKCRRCFYYEICDERPAALPNTAAASG